jgi:hypothetical protein
VTTWPLPSRTTAVPAGAAIDASAVWIERPNATSTHTSQIAQATSTDRNTGTPPANAWFTVCRFVRSAVTRHTVDAVPDTQTART